LTPTLAVFQLYLDVMLIWKIGQSDMNKLREVAKKMLICECSQFYL